MTVDIQKIRNIGIIAHIDAGKTTVTERILFHTGKTHRIGNVDEGTTVTDSMPQERERGITIQSAAVTTEWKGHQITIIDTPGHIDFTAEVQRALRVLDGGVVVFDGVAGVEPQSETVWRQADRYRVPRICFINKLDRAGANFWYALETIETRLGAHPLAIQMPIGSEKAFRGMIDLVEMHAYLYPEPHAEPVTAPIPAELMEEAQARREAMLELLADVDDEVAERYLEEAEMSPDFLRAAIRRATLAGALVPVLCGTALHDMGVQPLLDAVVAYLPAPQDIEPMSGRMPETGEEIGCDNDASQPLAALVFKVNTDPYVGRLAYIRVYDGVLRRGETVANPATGKKERIGRLVRMHADRREDVEEISAGDIGAILGMKIATTGETICAPSRLVVLEEISFPAPVVHLAIEPKTKADQDRLSTSLGALVDEDPTLRVRFDERTGQTILSGMGELHLEVVVDRLRREFNVSARVGQPQVAYCETITRPAQGEGRLVRQTGGRGQFAHVILAVEPLPSGTGNVIENHIVGGAIPRQFIPAVEAGIKEGLAMGALIGQPLIDIKVSILDGRFHEVDSSEQAFRTAAAMALKDAVLRAGPIILEPIMKVEVIAPEEYIGGILGDLSSKGGTVIGLDPRVGGVQGIIAHVPLAAMFGYAGNLRSITQGRGTFVMEFDHYAEVPAKVAEELRRVA
ncbi:MAG: elongation factor G [Anaerolineae bacterium]|nr:elongation factor G [Anaerolineae bacterium]